MNTKFKSPQQFFRQRRLRLGLVFAALLIIYLVSVIVVNFQTLTSLAQVPAGLVWLFKNFVPTQQSISYLGPILYQLWRTLIVAVSSTI